MTARRIAYSYNRYSSPQQSDGDSIRRQTALARAWCDRNGATLDISATYEDCGTSGFRGKHRESGMLRRFLDDVESGHIPRGSVLLIENMDRLSRERPVVGVNVLTGILLAGVRVVQLAPDEIELTEDSDLFSLFRGQMSQARGHDESKTKSARMSAVWGERQRAAREQGERITARLPGWLEVEGATIKKMNNGRAKVDGGTIHVIPDRARVVREVFRLATNGYGLALIVKHLAQKNVAPWGHGAGWSKAYVYKILTGRAVLGEYQPRKNGKPVGSAVLNYYPAIIDAGTWDIANVALSRRKESPGRIGTKSVALFAGLVWDARTGDKMLVSNQTRGVKGKRSKVRVLVPAGSMEGRGAAVSFPVAVFEDGVLACLKEIEPGDVYADEQQGEATSLAAELARTKASIDVLVADLDEHGDSPTLLRRLRDKEAAHAKLAHQLAEARAAEKVPKSAALAEARELIDAKKDTGTQLRLRQLLRESIERVTVLVVPGAGVRFAAVQITFYRGTQRDYLLAYRPGRGRTPGVVYPPRSFASLGEKLNLSKSNAVSDLETLLSALPVDALLKHPVSPSKVKK